MEINKNHYNNNIIYIFLHYKEIPGNKNNLINRLTKSKILQDNSYTMFNRRNISGRKFVQKHIIVSKSAQKLKLNIFRHLNYKLNTSINGCLNVVFTILCKS